MTLYDTLALLICLSAEPVQPGCKTGFQQVSGVTHTHSQEKKHTNYLLCAQHHVGSLIYNGSSKLHCTYLDDFQQVSISPSGSVFWATSLIKSVGAHQNLSCLNKGRILRDKLDLIYLTKSNTSTVIVGVFTVG